MSYFILPIVLYIYISKTNMEVFNYLSLLNFEQACLRYKLFLVNQRREYYESRVLPQSHLWSLKPWTSFRLLSKPYFCHVKVWLLLLLCFFLHPTSTATLAAARSCPTSPPWLHLYLVSLFPASKIYWMYFCHHCQSVLYKIRNYMYCFMYFQNVINAWILTY